MSSERTVAVITDGTADIPAHMVDDLGIIVVPLYVHFGDETFTQTDLSQREFFERMGAASELPTTSQPAVGDFEQAFASALDQATHVVAVHISEKLSGTIESARQAAERFGDRVHVFDSKNLSWGLALQVIEAARAAASGAGVEEVLRVADSARQRVRMLVGVEKLDNLAKGGRIGAVSHFLGGLLDLKVSFTVDPEGAFQPVGRTRGTRAALQHMLDWTAQQMDGHSSAAVSVMHAMRPENAEWLRERLESMFTVTDMYVVEVGAVIATHTGPGWGVAVLPAD